VISQQTKSGSNILHGSLYLNTAATQHGAARDPVSPQAQPIAGTNGVFDPADLMESVWAGPLGGPVQKDKTFFFGDYQGSRQQHGGLCSPGWPTARAGCD